MESIVIGNKQGDIKFFDDSIDLSSYQPYKLNSVKLFYTNQYILGIQAYYYSFKNQQIIKCNEHKPNKMFGVNEQKITLLQDEYVTNIVAYTNDFGISRMEIKTNRQELIIGLQEGDKKEYKLSENQQLAAISGGYGKQLQFLEWIIIQKHNQPQQQIYTSQLYQIFLQTFQPPITHPNFEYIGRNYRVCEPILIEPSSLTSKKYIQYKIIDDRQQCIFRQFREVIQLRDALQMRWPGIYIPPLVGRSTFDDYSNENIENTRKSIEYFIIKLSRIPFFVGSVEFGVFINKTNKEEAVEMEYVFQQLKEMSQPMTVEQVNMRYKQTFEEFETKEPVNESQRIKCNAFTQLMQKLEIIKLSDFLESKRLFEANTKNINQFSRYVLPDLHEMHQQIQVRKRSNSIDKAVQMQIDSMNDVYDFFLSEQREAQVMTIQMNYIKDLENQRIKLEQKLATNKLKPEEQQLTTNRLNSIHSIWSILVKAYATYYIDNFFKERYQVYLFMINRLATVQLSNLKQRQNFWLSI